MKTIIENRIEALIRQRQYQEALNLVELAMQLPLNATRLSLYRMTCLARLDRHEDCLRQIHAIMEQSFSPALSRNESNYIFLIEALSYSALNQRQACLNALSRVTHDQNSVYYQALLLKVKILLEQENYALALDLLRVIDPGSLSNYRSLDEEYLLLKSILLFRNGFNLESVALAKRAVDLYHDHRTTLNAGLKVEVMKILLEDMISEGKWVEAKVIADEIEQLVTYLKEPHQFIVALEILHLKGRIYCGSAEYQYVEKNFDEFIDCYKRALASNLRGSYPNQLLSELIIITLYAMLKIGITQGRAVEYLDHFSFENACDHVLAERDLAKATLSFLNGDECAFERFINMLPERYDVDLGLYATKVLPKWVNLTSQSGCMLNKFVGLLETVSINEIDSTETTIDELVVMMIKYFHINVKSSSSDLSDPESRFSLNCVVQSKCFFSPPKI